MLRLRFLLLVAAIVGGLWGPSGVTAQKPVPADSPRVVVGKDKAGPGGVALVSITFVSSANEPVSTASVDIGFSSKELTFQKAEEGDGVDVSAETTDDATSPEVRHLKVTARSKTKALDSGLLATLIFKISEAVPLGQKIPLKQKTEAFSGGASTRSVKVVGIDGEIDASASPGVFTCFFYMH